MKQLILHPKYLEQACVQVSGYEEGSGFLINGNRILTARHIVIDRAFETTNYDQKITIKVIFHNLADGDLEIDATLIADDFENDMALLELPHGAYQNVRILPLTVETPQYNSHWRTYGYPFEKSEGGFFHGNILQTGKSDRYDIDLECLVGLKNYSGLSGSPLVVGKQVCGIILYQKGAYLSAVSIAKIQDFLEKNKVNLAENTEGGNDDDELVSNEPVFEKLEAAITFNKNGFLLLSGSPGSGKTTTVNQFKSGSKDIVICGTYIINDGVTASAARSSRENLLEWLEFICINEKPEKTDMTVENHIKELPNYLADLSNFHRNKGEKAVIIIDGLDDVLLLGSNQLALFLSILPEKLPNNLTIVLSCTSKEILPNKIAAFIDTQREIKTQPLDTNACEGYILTHLPDLLASQAKILAERSEGHPLYLRYLIQYIKTQDDIVDLDNWLENVPVIYGQIKTYYEQVWSKIKDDSDRVWTALTVAQLRQPISEDILREMLTEPVRLTFHSHFPKLSFLFKNQRLVSIYHTSFREFISQKVQHSIKNVHDAIAEYCTQNRTTEYSISHIVHHLTHTSKPEQAIAECTQQWTDTCALHDVEPDLVLYDIQQVQGVCIDANKTVELIRVKLLLARISFRYNAVFKENAVELAEALIVIGRPKAALKYILRGKKILIPNTEISFFIQKLAYKGHIKEAKILYNAARQHINKMIEEGVSEGYLDLKIFEFIFEFILFLPEINSVEGEMDFEIAEDEYQHFRNVLDNIKNWATNFSDEHEVQIDNFIYIISSRRNAYHLWRFGFYMNVDQIKESVEAHGFKMNEKVTMTLAQTIVFYEHFEKQIEGSTHKSEKLAKIESDLEFMIDNYGYLEKDCNLLIHALIEESQRHDIVEKLLKQYLKPKKILIIRKPNGVDVDDKEINDYFKNQTYRGYIDTSNTFSEPANHRHWENFLVSIVDSLGFIMGKAYRLKAENRLSDMAPSVSAVEKIVKALGFPLAVRAKWERSYAIPEAVLPYIYSNVTQFYLNFATDEIPEFIKDIEHRLDDQIGLFTEGVRECLFVVAEKLSEQTSQRTNTAKVLKLLEQYIDKSVENRWERTRDFIRLLKLYGKIKNESKCKSVYQKMLDTSMGPSWYKEDHFSLVNTVLSNAQVKNCPISHFQDFAGILETASGEMTFQRYVRYEKEEFVGSLAKTGLVANAIEYLKFQLLPSPVQIIENAESSTVDTPFKGEGYVLGARGICEPNAICNLIEARPDANPLIRWAFCEVFVINEDIYRYAHDFAGVQAQILNQVSASKSLYLEMLCERLTHLIFHPKVKGEGQIFGDYVNYLNKTLTPTPLSILKEKMYTLYGHDWHTFLKKERENDEPIKKETALDMLPDFREKAEDELEIDNVDGAKKVIAEALQTLQNDNGDVWVRNWSNDAKRIFSVLKASCETDSELLSLLKPYIIEHKTEDWRIVSNLIEFLEDKLNPNQTDDLLKTVKEHLNLMVRSEASAASKYNWLSRKNTERSVDDQLLHFLIWLLNHPFSRYKSRLITSLTWLTSVEPDKLIPALFEECLTEKPLISTELSAYILQRICEQDATPIWHFIKNNREIQAKIVAFPHFMIKYYFKQMLISINRLNDSESKILFSQLEDTIPNLVIPTGEVFLEERYLMPIMPLIEDFNELGILNKAFCVTLFAKIKHFSKPLSEDEQMKANWYLNRSFRNEDALGYFDATLRYALNVAISARVSKKLVPTVVTILKSPFLA